MIASDVTGQRPWNLLPGDLRSLSPEQQNALAAYPILAATNKLCWRIVANRSLLSPSGCTLVARLLRAASRALESLRGGLLGIAVGIQLLIARVSLVARALAQDLAFGAASAAGSTNASLPQTDLLTLAEVESIDPALSVGANTTYAAFPTMVTILIDDLSFL